MVFILGLVGRFRIRMMKNEAKYIDKRVKLVTDMVAGIRTIKAYGWEEAYAEKVN